MKFVAIAERSAGNEQVGDMWLETKIFDPNTPVSEIWDWSEKKRRSGRLIITLADEDATP